MWDNSNTKPIVPIFQMSSTKCSTQVTCIIICQEIWQCFINRAGRGSQKPKAASKLTWAKIYKPTLAIKQKTTAKTAPDGGGSGWVTCLT